MPIRTSKAFFPISTAGWNSVPARGSSRSRRSMAVRMLCLIPVECFASWWICAFVLPPSAFCTWSTARGTATQSKSAKSAAKTR